MPRVWMRLLQLVRELLGRATKVSKREELRLLRGSRLLTLDLSSLTGLNSQTNLGRSFHPEVGRQRPDLDREHPFAV
jgi:hypothetical protein